MATTDTDTGRTPPPGTGGSGLPGGTPPPGFGPSRSWVHKVVSTAHEWQPVFEPAEVAALVKYAAENGIDADEKLLTQLLRSLVFG
jgi:hypothetical protein